MFYIYILKSHSDEQLYIGFTTDLKKRFQEHKNGFVDSTRARRPLELVYYEAYKDRDDAKNRESRLKRFSRAYVQLKNRINKSIH